MKINDIKNIITCAFVLLFAQGIAQNNKALFEANFKLGKLLYDQGKYEDAVQSLEKSYELAQKIFNRNDAKIVETASILADDYKKIHHLDRAADLYLLVLKSTRKSSVNPPYNSLLMKLVEVYAEQEQYEKILPLYLEALENDEKQYGKNHFKYAISLRNLADVYNSLGETEKALTTALEAENKLDITLGKEDIEYANCESVLANIYDIMGDYNQSIAYFTKATVILEKKTESKRFEYGKSLLELAKMNKKAGKFNLAVSLYLKSLDQMEQAGARSHSEYGRGLSSLGDLYRELGEYDKSEQMLLKGLEVVEKSLGKNHSEYSTSLDHLAYLYETMGQYDNALKLFQEIVNSTEKTFGKESQYYAYSIGNMAMVYMKKKQDKLALPYCLEAMDIIKKTLGTDHPEYAMGLTTLGILYENINEYDKALIAYKEAIVCKEKWLGNEHLFYIGSLSKLGRLYSKMGMYDQALPLLLESLTKIVKLGNQNAEYQMILDNLITFYIKKNQYEKALPYCLEANQDLIKKIKAIFNFKSENDKKLFLAMILKNFDFYESFDYQTKNTFNELTETNLNSHLVLKGILLNSSKDVYAKLSTLNDTVINEDIASLRTLKETLNKQYAIVPSKRTLNIDSLSIKVNRLEANLVKKYVSQFKNDFDIEKNWRDIQSKLSKDQAAVEFSKFDYKQSQKWTDSTIYIAYVIKKEWPNPKVVHLFEEKQMREVLKQKIRGSIAEISSLSISSSAKIYDMVWKPIEKYLGNVKTVYYAPDGLLHQLSFAAIGPSKDKLLCQQYNLIQVSSTSVIADGQIEPSIVDTKILGGINYDYTSGEKEPVDNAYSYIENEKLKNSHGTRGPDDKWEYLAGTLSEAQGIASIFQSKGKHYQILEGVSASESAFKALSGKSPSILHIATHGFFFENIKNDKRREAETNQYIRSEDPLMRSGLILAGANQAWLNGSNPYEEEDGILTSMEISNLDLSKTDMVVLSACDTGLGDIEDSEGVYGLQRAFKMAGVKIIVMSLWQVPDAETAEFMKLFYGNWLKGAKVREAFNNAQKTMMKKYRNEPLKWAGFVMFE